jgi:hypothetical protein
MLFHGSSVIMLGNIQNGSGNCVSVTTVPVCHGSGMIVYNADLGKTSSLSNHSDPKTLNLQTSLQMTYVIRCVLSLFFL